MIKVVLGLSDGVDSCVSAYMLKQRGYEVLGVYMDIGTPEQRESARINAEETGVGFKAVNVDAEMEKWVKQPFAEAYLNGRTPMPCTVCNREVKLPVLLNAAVSFGAEYVATGHYVRTDGERLYMGKPDCDQSYMLSRLTHDQVCRLLLPLGEMNKSRVRELASSLGFSCASRPDSRENCFIGDKSYVSYLERTYGDRIPGGGDVVYEGKTIGRHDGIYRYTVGQRWKDYIGERRAYVKRIDAKENTIELCLWEQLFTNRVRLGDISFISGSAPADEFDGAIRVRHTRWETPPCHVIMAGEDTAYVETASPLRAPAPGQSAALYSGDMLLGGGTVEEC